MSTYSRLTKMLTEPQAILITCSGKIIYGALTIERATTTCIDDVWTVGGKSFRTVDVGMLNDEAQMITLRRPSLVRLIEDARAAGYEITDANALCRIRVSPKGIGLDLWADGTATRNDVQLDLALTIRSAAQMREILGL